MKADKRNHCLWLLHLCLEIGLSIDLKCSVFGREADSVTLEITQTQILYSKSKGRMLARISLIDVNVILLMFVVPSAVIQ
jgi:hypothetical protein